MKTSTRPWLAMTILAVQAAACEGLTTAPVPGPSIPSAAAIPTSAATRSVYETVWDLNGAIFSFTCDYATYSEDIVMEGEIRERWSIVTDANGWQHGTFQTKGIGLGGTGAESGHRYRVRESSHAIQNESAMRFGGSFQERLLMENTVTGDRFSLVGRGSFTFNANGVLVVDRWDERTECQL